MRDFGDVTERARNTYRPGDAALTARERHEHAIALARIRRTLERQADAEAIRQFVNEEGD